MSTSVERIHLVLGSVLPGGQALPRAEWEWLAWASPATLSRFSEEVRLMAGAAMISARTAVGRGDDAVELACREINRVSVAGAVDLTRAGADLLLLSAAEAHAMAGDHIHTCRYAEMVSSSVVATTPVRWRALGLLALGRALNGEYALAREADAQATGLASGASWDKDEPVFPLLMARVLIASAVLDAPRLHSLAESFRDGGHRNPVWESTSLVVDAMALLSRGAIPEAMAVTRRVLQGSGGRGTLPMVRGFALGVRADLLLIHGDPAQTLALLDGEASPPGHALCFNMQRAAALLALGNNAAVLPLTDPCIHMGPQHCLRTITPLLLRRAVARERLGDHEGADGEFEEAVHLLRDSGSHTPLLAVPRFELSALLDRLSHSSPRLAPALDSIRRQMEAVPRPEHESVRLPALTARENDTAQLLLAGVSNREIATRLVISPNTVKVHIRNLYAKLGVTDRRSAITALHHAGFR